MAKIIVVYSTIEGHTRNVATDIAETIQARGHQAVLIDGSTALPGLLEEGEYDSAIMCGSVHQGKHSSDLSRIVTENLSDLGRIPTGFVSVSLSTAMPDPESQAEAQSYVDEFLAETGWKPDETVLVGGALLFTQYDYLKRLIVRVLSKRRGGETDASHDYVLTDWDGLRAFVEGFLERRIKAHQ